MKVKVINKSKFELPKYETEGSAGIDLQANIEEPITLNPLERALIPTGFIYQCQWVTKHKSE